MATVDERVAFLEGRVVEQSERLDDIRDAIVHLEQRMDRRFDLLEQRFTGIDQRFIGIDQRFIAIDRRLDAIDGRFALIDQRLLGLDQRIDHLDAKFSRQFMWLVGMQVTTLVAIVAALLAR